MARRAFKVAALVLSHLSAFVLTAAWAVGHHSGAALRAAAEDPLYRLGLHFADLAPDTAAQFPPFEQDLQALAGKLTPPALQVLQLMQHLGEAQLAEAGAACAALSWPSCDPATLTEMRKALGQ